MCKNCIRLKKSKSRSIFYLLANPKNPIENPNSTKIMNSKFANQ